MTVVSEHEPGAELPERWSAMAKTEVVLRLCTTVWPAPKARAWRSSWGRHCAPECS
jgi:hypothetical protein